ncbi:MAG TPA: lysophospholipid acyltransferase family protein [Pyrinomonadaceae bacterium]
MQASAEHRFKGARAPDETIARVYQFADLSAYSLKQRILIRAADLAFFVLINLIGRTIRWQVEGWENWEAATAAGQVPIYTFWHNRIFTGTYFWRQRGIVVMTSQSFDGEYIARFIQRFGYGAVRGSSTRGAVGAIVEMARLMRAGLPTGFSIDGPKGPRYIAKMGAVLLAKKTGQPILPFTFNPRRFWEAKGSWDGLQVPLPFSRVSVRIAAPIYVSADANDEALEAKRDELQATLDRINRVGALADRIGA